MNGSILAVIAIAAIAVIGGAVFFMGGNLNDDSSETTVNETIRDTVTEIDTGESSDQGASNAENNTSSDYTFTITYVSGTENAYQITSSSGQYTVTFSGISADTEYSIAGVLNGNIVIDAGDYDFDLDLKDTEHIIILTEDLEKFLSKTEVRYYLEGRTGGIHGVIENDDE